MPKGYHGDRLIDPEPLEELVARHELEIEGAVEYHPKEFDEFIHQQTAPIPTEMPKNYEAELDAGMRMQSAAIAGGSFGAAGCFDDDMLLRRANAIFNFIRNGLA